MWTCYFSAVVVKYQNHEQLGGGRLNAGFGFMGDRAHHGREGRAGVRENMATEIRS